MFTSPSGKAVGLVRATLLDLGHLHQQGLPLLKGPLARAFSGSFSTKATRAAVPVGHWAAAHRAVSCTRTTLFAFGQLHEFGNLGLKGAVSGSCSTVGGIRAQNQLGIGQQPAGHGVPSHCLLLASFMSLAILASSLQSAAVGAQFTLSAQQNQLG